jgi:integrase
MAIFKRGNVYSYHFLWNGEHVQKSTQQQSLRVARQIEAAHRTALAKGDAGIFERKPAPSFKDFGDRFLDAIKIHSAQKPRTIEFYSQQFARLLDFEPLASARLDKIDEALIESYVQDRAQNVSPATVNRALATLRRALRLGQEWRVIDRVPRIRLLKGERNREFVLGQEQEYQYLNTAPQPLRDVALLMVDTGLRIGEALGLEWRDVPFEPAEGAKFGYLHVRQGEMPGERDAGLKSKNARRNVPLTDRVRDTLRGRRSSNVVVSLRVFADDHGEAMLTSSLDHQHQRVREGLKMPADFVLHSLRHSYGTRLGEAGADAFAIMRLMGHSSVTVSQRHVHPTPEGLERAVERLEALNRKARERARDQLAGQEPAAVSEHGPATISANMAKAIARK